MLPKTEQETKNGLSAVRAKARKEWRAWLNKNHDKEQAVWLILFNKNAKNESVSYEEAVEEALCYGWIDSRANKRDEESHYLYFARRKPKGNWSQSNKERVERLTAQGLMTPAGQVFIDLAKANGAWDNLTDVENEVVPDDLQEHFDEHKTAFKNYQAFSASSRRAILAWIKSARKSETRAKRIQQTVELAERNIKANT